MPDMKFSARRAQKAKPLGFKPRAPRPLWSTCLMRQRCLERLLRFVRKSSYTNLRTFLPILNQAAWQRALRVLRVFGLREHGILVTAALESGVRVRRLIAQSLACWVYAPGPQPYSENDPLDLRGDGPYAIVVEGVVALERLTRTSPPLEGVVLRYGQIYGPGTSSEEPTGSTPLHVDAAAHAALLAIEGAKPGIFNIAEDTGYVSIAKARRELGWDPGFRLRFRETTGVLSATTHRSQRVE
jgi:hypothetical protein